jgi:ABC-2 type transport system ATP-binding protein
MRAADARRSAAQLLERFRLEEAAKSRVDSLSRGMAQKVQLAAALVGEPRLLLLDEPFSGLDPVNQMLLEDVVRERARGGAAVVLSTHVMEHAERLCDRLLLISHGRKLFAGTPEEARHTLPARLTLSAREDPRGLPGIREATAIESRDGWTEWRIALQPGAAAGDLLEAAFERGIKLREFAEHRPSLHEVFVHLVGGEEAGG